MFPNKQCKTHLFRFQMQLLLLLVAAFLPFSLTLAQVSLDRKAEVVLEKVNILICGCKSHSQIVQKIWKLNLVLLGKSHFLREQNLCCTLFCCWGEEDRWWTRVLCNYFRRWRGNIFDTSNHPLISRYNKIIWIKRNVNFFLLPSFALSRWKVLQ